MQQIDQVLIPVENVSPGMFPTERTVQIRGADDRDLTLFVDDTLIERRGQQAYLRVTRVETDRTSAISVCILPSSAAEGTRWVRIANAALLETAA